MSEPIATPDLRDRIAGKLIEWALEAAAKKDVKLSDFHRHIIGVEAPERADMVMTVVQPELDRLHAALAEYRGANTRMQQLIVKRADERDQARIEKRRAVTDGDAARADAEVRVHQMFADLDDEAISLDRLTVTELVEMVMQAIRGGEAGT